MKKTFLNSMFLLLSGLALAGCNSGGGGGGGEPTNTATTPLTCSVDMVYNSTYGCLAQTGCPVGYGMYNNQCLPATTQAYGTCNVSGQVYHAQYGCLTQSPCPTGYGMYNNTCVPVSVSGIGNYNQFSCQSGSSMCGAGSVQTQYGCLPQAHCGSCSGLYNGSCIPGQVQTQYIPTGGMNTQYYYYSTGTPYYAGGSLFFRWSPFKKKKKNRNRTSSYYYTNSYR